MGPRVQSQGYSNHRRVFPLYHLVAMPVLYANVVVQAIRAIRHPAAEATWSLVVAIALVGALIAVRASTLVVQNRLISLEMRLRLAALLPPALRARIPELTVRQLIGLRFAGDAELPALVERCLSGELTTADQVKREVTDWRADYLRA